MAEKIKKLKIRIYRWNFHYFFGAKNQMFAID